MSESETPGSMRDRFREVLRRTDQWLPGGGQPSPSDELASLISELDELDESDEPGQWDRYGGSGPVAALEAEIARLLDKPSAVMFPSGTMGQQSSLRVWTDRRQSRRVALPSLSHLLHHELDGPQLLHGFRYERLTTGPQVPVADDLAEIPGPLGAVLLELPLRDAGYLLPSWDELAAFAEACRARDVPLHFDGARIWESQPYLRHSLVEIAALADSVYVSFYKGLRGMTGAAVAGPEDVMSEVRQWRTRHGGTLFTMLPYAVSALRGLREELPRAAEYHEHASALAVELADRGIATFPTTPHTNAFRIFVNDDADDVNRRVIEFMEQQRTALTPAWEAADVPGWSWTEFTVGPATMKWTPEDAAELLASVLLRR